MRNPFTLLTKLQWAGVGRACTVFSHLIVDKAKETPYFHIRDPKTGEVYMERWWLFNPEPSKVPGEEGRVWHPDLPSARVHHIMRPDSDRHLHNHPWDAVSIILDGWYDERRADGQLYRRSAGDVVGLEASTFHSIERVSPGGVWTLFITGQWQQSWGFQTEHGFVPWRVYLNVPEGEG